MDHICFVNILVSLALVHQRVWGLCLVTWRNFVLVWKGNQNSILNSLLINSSIVWEISSPPHPMTVKTWILRLQLPTHDPSPRPGFSPHWAILLDFPWVFGSAIPLDLALFFEDATLDWGPWFCTDIWVFWSMTQLYSTAAGKRHLPWLSLLLPQTLFNSTFSPSIGDQGQLGFLHSRRSSSEKCLAIVKRKGIEEITRRRKTRKS